MYKDNKLRQVIEYAENLRKFCKTMKGNDPKYHDYQYYLGRMTSAKMIRDHARLLLREKGK